MSTPSEAQLAVTKKCQELVEAYRAQQATRAEVVRGINSAINEADFDTEDARDRALDSYLDMVFETDSERRSGRSRERSRVGAGRSRSRGRRSLQDRSKSPERRGPERSSSRTSHRQRDKSPRPSQRHSRRHRRRRSASSSSRQTVDSDDDATRRKPKANAKKYGWAPTVETLKPSMRPEVKRTTELLREYRIDVAAAKADLLDSTFAPEFPESEWTNLLLGKPVDFDVVFAGRYSSKSVEKHVEQLGDVELSYQAREPSKKVETSWDWIGAWEAFQRAMLFAFPHRSLELSTYRDHISEVFSSTAVSLHHRVFDYERACRKRVAFKRSLLLSDIFEFNLLHNQYVGSSGANFVAAEAEASKGSGSGKSKVARKADACLRFNARKCPALASQCKYRHVCSGCNAKGHIEPECPTRAGKHEA